MSEGQPVVIDNGSYKLKAGFAGDDNPKTVFPSVKGILRKSGYESRSHSESNYIGEDAIYSERGMILKSPFDNGIIYDWETMEQIWHYTFYNKLRIFPDEHPILLSENLSNPFNIKEKSAQIMFETFNVPAYYSMSQEELASHSLETSTYIIVNCGHESTTIWPVIDNSRVSKPMMNEIGGNTITKELQLRLLINQQKEFIRSFDLEILRDMKDKLCYVAEDYTKEMEKNEDEIERSFEWPDQTIITLCYERIKCPEIVFNPFLIDIECDGIHEMIYNSIMKCDETRRKELFNNIVLVGGTTLLPGFKERIEKEMKSLVPEDISINVIAKEERQFLPWIGGSIIANSPDFQNNWITKEEYDEFGPSVVHKK